jgi:hypothetical protein
MEQDMPSPSEIKRQHEDYMRTNLELYGLFMDKTGEKAIAIIKYIKDNQDKNQSKEDVARYIDNAGILSRPVTLRIIKKLLDNKIILNDPKKPNAQSRLIINSEYDFKKLELDLISSLIIEIRFQFDPLDIETRGVNTTLIPQLVRTIEDFSKKEDIYTPKQMEKFKADYQKKTVKQLKKLSAFRDSEEKKG